MKLDVIRDNFCCPIFGMQHASNLSLKFMNDFSPKLDNKQEII